jgi:hydroxypyruvate isomerase
MTSFSRRNVLKLMGATTAVLATAPAARLYAADAAPLQLKGRIKQGLCMGALKGIKDFEEICKICARLGIKGIDFTGPKQWETMKKYGLVGTLTRHDGMSIAKGFNRKENHAEQLAGLRKAIEETSAAGFPNVICMSGNRAGMSDDEGLANCVIGLKQIAAFAEEKKVNVCMELLNSKRNHKDYQCDRTAWGVELCKRVGSERIKLLYDIYHMQIMEGDVIATIKESVKYIGHMHTAGNPGRHEIDGTQELFYPAIMRAVVESGYTGYVSHEYTPTRDAVTSLEQAVKLCDV